MGIVQKAVRTQDNVLAVGIVQKVLGSTAVHSGCIVQKQLGPTDDIVQEPTLGPTAVHSGRIVQKVLGPTKATAVASYKNS